MPIPKPQNNESQQDFINRCMQDETMIEEYQDPKQRLAVCTSTYNQENDNNL